MIQMIETIVSYKIQSFEVQCWRQTIRNEITVNEIWTKNAQEQVFYLIMEGVNKKK